jgi:hypothetical protein
MTPHDIFWLSITAACGAITCFLLGYQFKEALERAELRLRQNPRSEPSVTRSEGPKEPR